MSALIGPEKMLNALATRLGEACNEPAYSAATREVCKAIGLAILLAAGDLQDMMREEAQQR